MPGRRVYPSAAADMFCRRRRVIELQRGMQRSLRWGGQSSKFPAPDAVGTVPLDIRSQLHSIEPRVLSPLPANDAV